jgi:hypothetical protein
VKLQVLEIQYALPAGHGAESFTRSLQFLSWSKNSPHFFFPHTHTVLHLDIFNVSRSPTDAQFNRLKNNFKIYIKIDIKTAPTCFGAITIIMERIIRAC